MTHPGATSGPEGEERSSPLEGERAGEEPSNEASAAEGPEAGQGDSPSPEQPAEESAGQQTPSRAPKRRQSTPRRIALILVVLLGLVASAMEVIAWLGHRETVLGVRAEFNRAQAEGTGLYRDGLSKLIRGFASRRYDEATRTETWTWYGIRAYHLEVKYRRPDFVDKIKSYRTFLGWGGERGVEGERGQ
ncbi:MAG TPA: hypothetical protein EYP56_17885 [Planctomycetaceae bacterium]|nr:hypothetical protein [Planctomycetaceae bacterium]HIQ22521.1 hypothetical protein [Planctomycetota bacterium]